MGAKRAGSRKHCEGMCPWVAILGFDSFAFLFGGRFVGLGLGTGGALGWSLLGGWDGSALVAYLTYNPSQIRLGRRIAISSELG